MLFAQITDLHIRAPGLKLSGRVDTADFLARAVAKLNRLDPRPAFLLITGDLVDRGSVDEYVHLAEHLAPLVMPVRLALGNHDGRDGFRAVFGANDYWDPAEPFVQYVIDAGPVRLLVLDTLDTGRPSGALCDHRLDWLAARLAEDRTTPTIVALHHPPVRVGMSMMDSMCLLDGAARFHQLIAAAPNVDRVLAGHLHRQVTTRFAGTVLDVMPGVAHQCHLDLAEGVSQQLIFEPPMIQLHLWVEGTGLVSHKVLIDDFDGPYSFASPD
ncbi:MAG: phosphodiesterase [Alphaproteobacteria bacterium]|nr:phosphodiesterase [Alphaproteobacteria bacterium]